MQPQESGSKAVRHTKVVSPHRRGNALPSWKDPSGEADTSIAWSIIACKQLSIAGRFPKWRCISDHLRAASLASTTCWSGYPELWDTADRTDIPAPNLKSPHKIIAATSTHGIAPVERGHPAYAYMWGGKGDGVVSEECVSTAQSRRKTNMPAPALTASEICLTFRCVLIKNICYPQKFELLCLLPYLFQPFRPFLCFVHGYFHATVIVLRRLNLLANGNKKIQRHA